MLVAAFATSPAYTFQVPGTGKELAALVAGHRALPRNHPEYRHSTRIKEQAMAKGYWMVAYHEIKNQEAFQAYAKAAMPVITAAGGKYLVRGNPAAVHESGLNQRVVLIEFPSLQ